MTSPSLATRLLCTGCGHDQAGHDPANVPPYTCCVAGCRCSRTPDALVLEAPKPLDPSQHADTVTDRPADLDECPRCGGHGELATRRNRWGMWESRTCPFCDGTGTLHLGGAA